MPFLAPESKDYEKNLKILGPSLSETIFRPFAEKRQPRTSLLVKGARAQGDRRVAAGAEACKQREEAIVASYQDPSVIADKFDGLLREPFQTL